MTASVKQSKSNSGSLALLVVSALLTVVGVAAWVVQLSRGIGATGLSNINVWGVYIAGFVFFMGLSAGSLVLASLPVIFDLPKFRPVGNVMAFVALASLVAGGLFILVDIGKPDRLWRLVSFGRFSSPMLWDMLLTVVYLVVSTVFLRQLLAGKPGATLKGIAWVALLAGVADGLTAFVFATQVAHEFWFSAVQPLSFFAGALASACAVALVLVVILKSAASLTIEYPELSPLSWLMAAVLGLNLLLIVSEVVTLAFTRSDSAMKLVQYLLASPLFWVEVISAVLAIVILVLPSLRSQAAWITSAGVLGLVHLAAKRMSFVDMGFALPNITYPGVKIAPAGPYVPNLLEWGLVLGLVGLFTLLMTVGFKTLKLGVDR